jgi:uncharacterized protein (TIGR00369 family)
MNEADLMAFLASDFPQAQALGLEILSLDAERLRLRQPVGEQHLRPGGTVSGPALMALADVGFYLLLLSRIGRVPLAVTTSLNINFTGKAAPGAPLVAEARMLKLGKRLAVGEVSLYSDGREALAAHVTLTYSIPPRSQ